MSEDHFDPLITECPSCRTRFRVSEAHLQRAGGRVRCGACLTVFHGVQNLTVDSARLFADEDQARRALDALLEELTHDPAPPTPPLQVPPRSPAPLFGGFEGASPGPEAVEAAPPLEAFTFRVVGEPEEDDADRGEEAPADAAGPAELPALPVQADPAPATASNGADTPASAGPAPSAAEPASPPTRFGEPRTRQPWVWLAIAGGLVLLVAQVLWYRFDDWATTPAGREFYGAVCATLGCELPVQRDTSQLATRNLAVRSHPREPGMLLVSAVIANEAEFAQPFPVLELRFTTVRGMLVAGRRFRPQEYLAGDAAGLTLIPPRTPVQIELPIDDPGSEAVNYFLKLH